MDKDKAINDHDLSLTQKQIDDHNAQCLVRCLKDAEHLADLFAAANNTNGDWLKKTAAFEKSIKEVNEVCKGILLREIKKRDASLLCRAINQQYPWDRDYQLFRFVLIEKGGE